jgi:hypothetical protein
VSSYESVSQRGHSAHIAPRDLSDFFRRHDGAILFMSQEARWGWNPVAEFESKGEASSRAKDLIPDDEYQAKRRAILDRL